MKYKVVNNKTGKLDELATVLQDGSLYQVYFCDGEYCPDDIFKLINPENYTILLSTGKEDINGKLSYEGDIIKNATYCRCGLDCPHEPEYDELVLGSVDSRDHRGLVGESEVTGNIHIKE